MDSNFELDNEETGPLAKLLPCPTEKSGDLANSIKCEDDSFLKGKQSFR